MRVGSLFSGYGGLDMALGGNVAWYSEIEPAACRVLSAHHPGISNLGDITKIEWADAEPVDILTGGYPCQPFSNAGLRKGANDPRHLWPYVRDAIGALRPKLAILENVRGHLSLGLANVIGELAGLGYDAKWGLVRASDAGAPHARARVFIVAYPYGDGHGLQLYARTMGSLEKKAKSDSQQRQRSRRQSDPRDIVDVADSSSVNAQERQGNRQRNRDKGRLKSGNDYQQDWGKYSTAITRWETLTRPAPFPVKDDRVNTCFVEWMMGLPEGHVTGHGLTVTQELRLLGNGVCPQQAQLAIKLLSESGIK